MKGSFFGMHNMVMASKAYFVKVSLVGTRMTLMIRQLKHVILSGFCLGRKQC